MITLNSLKSENTFALEKGKIISLSADLNSHNRLCRACLRVTKEGQPSYDVRLSENSELCQLFEKLTSLTVSIFVLKFTV